MLLPNMNGGKIFEEIYKLTQNVPVVFISGKVLDEKEIRTKGAFAFIKKPFDIEGIFSILNKIVENKNTKVRSYK